MRRASRSAQAVLDRRRVADITDQLNRIDLRKPSLRPVLEPLRTLLGAETMLVHGYQFDGNRLDVDWADVVSRCTNPESLVETFRVWRGASNDPWVSYNILRPEHWQRNPERVARYSAGFLPAVGMAGFDQLRAVIFDRGAAVGWVGGFRPQPFGRREVRLLNEVVPSLRRRFRYRKLLEQEVTVERVLEALSSATFVVRQTGELVHGNSAGIALWNADRQGIAEALRRALRGEGTGGDFEVAPIVEAGEGRLFLATRRRDSDLAGRVAHAARRWGLTPRQTEVLARVVGGASNLGASLDLGCSVKTVETHLAATFDKAQVPSRSALVAKVLSERG
jgi:DNA-binding NarL/FixJ family response regulator